MVNISRQVIGQNLLNERKITGEEVRNRPLNDKTLSGLDIPYIQELRAQEHKDH